MSTPLSASTPPQEAHPYAFAVFSCDARVCTTVVCKRRGINRCVPHCSVSNRCDALVDSRRFAVSTTRRSHVMISSPSRPSYFRASLCIALSCIWAGSADAQVQYRIATEGSYPPWSFRDTQGLLKGWDIDIANALCEKMKARCEIVAQDWDGIIPGLLAHKYDMIVASMAITEQRRQRVAFSEKYKETVSRFIARKGAPADVGPEALRAKVIGVQRGSIQAAYLSQNYRQSELKFYDTPQAAELDLVAGRVDYILGNKVTYFVGFMKTPAASDFAFTGPDLQGGILGEGNGIALRKQDTELLARINAALEAIRSDGTYDRITAKYFPFKLM